MALLKTMGNWYSTALSGLSAGTLLLSSAVFGMEQDAGNVILLSRTSAAILQENRVLSGSPLLHKMSKSALALALGTL